MPFIYIIRELVYLFISVLQFAMLARAVLSWIPMIDGDGKMGEFLDKLASFLYFLTEPIIIPFRKLFDKFDSLRSFPLDIPFFVAFLVINMITLFI